MSRRLRIKYSDEPAMSIARRAFRDQKLVYLACANKRIGYAWGRSRIVYIGTTGIGAHRMANSAFWRGEEVLGDHGVNYLNFFVVTCTRKQRVPSWKKLEKALLIKFKEKFGEPPWCNIKGKRMRWDDEKDYFADWKLDEVIETFS